MEQVLNAMKKVLMACDKEPYRTNQMFQFFDILSEKLKDKTSMEQKRILQKEMSSCHDNMLEIVQALKDLC